MGKMNVQTALKRMCRAPKITTQNRVLDIPFQTDETFATKLISSKYHDKRAIIKNYAQQEIINFPNFMMAMWNIKRCCQRIRVGGFPFDSTVPINRLRCAVISWCAEMEFGSNELKNKSPTLLMFLTGQFERWENYHSQL